MFIEDVGGDSGVDNFDFFGPKVKGKAIDNIDNADTRSNRIMCMEHILL